MKTLLHLQIILFLLVSLHSVAQGIEITAEMQQHVELYNAKINELIDKHTKNGFAILSEEKLPMRSNIDMVVHIPLHAGNWYHFCFIGDPGADKIKANLFLEGLGDFVADRIVVRREHEFWTEFSFMCTYNGSYELTLNQKAEISRPLSYLVVFQKTTEMQLTSE